MQLAQLTFIVELSQLIIRTQMQTKLSQVKQAFESGDFSKAIRIAAKFHDLGDQRNAILDANLAMTNPRWMAAIGKDIDQAIALGIEALRIRYAFQ